MALKKRQRSQIFGILSSIIIMMALIVFSGCGDDDDDDSPKTDGNGQQGDSRPRDDESRSDTEVLIADLSSAGVKVTPMGDIAQPFFAVKGQVLKVDNEEIQVFEYATEQAAEEDALQVAPDGCSIGPHMVNWIATPHFFRRDKLIVLYVGDSIAVLDKLTKILGSKFAGG